MTPNNQPDDPKLTASLFSKEMQAFGYQLDFSLQSLESEIDRILETFPLNSQDAKYDLEAKLTAYIGEAMCQNLNGFWSGAFYSHKSRIGNNYYFCKITIGKHDFYPEHFIGYYICNGKNSTGTFQNYFTKTLAEWRLT